MKGHLDASTLAAHREGLLRGRPSARIDSHLDSCPACAELAERLDNVTAVLSAVPAPAMPQAVVARLDAALAAESAARTGLDLPAVGNREPDDLPPTGLSARGAHQRAQVSRRSRLALRMAGAAAALVVAGIGTYAVSQTGSPSAGTSARSAASATLRPGPPATGSATGSGPPALIVNGRMRYPVVASGTDYRKGQLGAQADATLARYAGRTPGPRTGPPVSGAQPGSALAACVAQVIHGSPVLVDIARYAGRPAAVIVASSGPRRVVWVVSSNCSAGDVHVIATAELPSGH